MSGNKLFGLGNKAERRFLSFEEKSIDEQADDITQALVFAEENPLFEFDRQDQSKRHDFFKSVTGAVMALSILTVVDIRVLNRIKGAKEMGPMRKIAFVGFLQMPFLWYFYTDVRGGYTELQRHLVTKYLISGDELLYKRPIVDMRDGIVLHGTQTLHPRLQLTKRPIHKSEANKSIDIKL